MCHSVVGRFLCRALLCLLAMHAPVARAQTAPGIEQTFANSLTTIPTENLGVSGAFYIPAYSSVSMSQGKTRADFSVTLSIHNASETRPLVLKRLAYFDTGGKMVESYLKAPIALKPLSTVEVFVPTTDVRRGADARRARQRTLCIHQPGPADQGRRQKLELPGSRDTGSLNDKKNQRKPS